jgi:hypothetical protein
MLCVILREASGHTHSSNLPELVLSLEEDLFFHVDEIIVVGCLGTAIELLKSCIAILSK